MANQIIKKIIIPRKDITSISSDGLYHLRYRIISEDKTRLSDWSPFYPIDGSSFQTTSNVILLTQETNGVNVVWGIPDTIKPKVYDVYVRYDDGSAVAYNDPNNTTATELTGFVATLASGTNLVTLTTGTTQNMKVGQAVTKTSGTGAFATTTVYIKTITGTTTFTVSNINGVTANHATSGSTTFKVVGESLNYYTSTSSENLFLPKPAVGVKVSVAILAQSYPQYTKIASFNPIKPNVFLVESTQLTIV